MPRINYSSAASRPLVTPTADHSVVGVHNPTGGVVRLPITIHTGRCGPFAARGRHEPSRVNGRLHF